MLIERVTTVTLSMLVIVQLISNIQTLRNFSPLRKDTLIIFSTNDEFSSTIDNPQSVSFTVFQEPRPLSRHMTTKGYMYNPSAKYQKQFLDESKPFLPVIPFQGPLEVSINFYFTRPKNHFRSGKLSHILKPNAPFYHNGRRDIDNLVKFVLDALNKHAYKDDGQISLLKSGKFYCSNITQARIEVSITSLGDDEMMTSMLSQ